MKGANIRPRSTAVKKKSAIPPALKKILASNIKPELTTKKSSPKLVFPDISFFSDIQSPKAILRSFEGFGTPSPQQFPTSTKHSIVGSRQTPISPEMPSGFTFKSTSPMHRSTIPRSPMVRSPTASSIRIKEKSRFDEEAYLALKEKTQVYYTSPIPLTNESKQEILVEEDSLMMDRLGQTMMSSQYDGHRPASQTIIVPIKYDKIKETENKADSYVMNQKKRQVKDKVLRKILSETNMSTIRTKESLLLGAKENKSMVKPLKVIRLKRNENKLSKAATLNNSKTLLLERSESPKQKEMSINDQSSGKLYKSIRLKYLVDPNAEEEMNNNLPSKLRSFICESINNEDMKTKSINENSLLKGQKFTGRFTKIDNAFARDGDGSSQRIKRDSERNNNIERISGRCAQKEKRVTELVEELRLANSLMLKETITLDRSRISKSSIKTRKNVGDLINLYPAFTRINS